MFPSVGPRRPELADQVSTLDQAIYDAGGSLADAEFKGIAILMAPDTSIICDYAILPMTSLVLFDERAGTPHENRFIEMDPLDRASPWTARRICPATFDETVNIP